MVAVLDEIARYTGMSCNELSRKQLDQSLSTCFCNIHDLYVDFSWAIGEYYGLLPSEFFAPSWVELSRILR